MRHRLPPVAVGLAAVTGLLVGTSLTLVGAPDAGILRAPARGAVPLLEPIRALPRTPLMLAMIEAREHLAAERPWSAWLALRDHIDFGAVTSEAELLAARAAAEWGGWEHVREILRGERWLGHVAGGEGWLLLARAEEKAENWERAADAYARFIDRAEGMERGEAEARRAIALARAGEPAAAARAWTASASRLETVRDWMLVGAAEAAPGGELPDLPADASPAARVRRTRAEVAAWKRAGAPERALARVNEEVNRLVGQGALAEAAVLVVDRARLLQAAGRTVEARDALRSAAWESSATAETRREAARLLGELAARPTAAEELARSAAYAASDRPGLAAKSLRAALAAGAPDDASMRFRLGKLLYEARDFGPARAALLDAAAGLSDAEQAAEAELLAARSRFRAGKKAEGLAEIRRVAERFAGTAAAGTALFLLADESASLDAAIPLYRRAAGIERSPDAREALFRVGDRELRRENRQAALQAWEEYLRRYPSGEETARVAYNAGLLYERGRQEAQARRMYQAAVAADPLSYYAVRAADRLGVDPLGSVFAAARPWTGTQEDVAQTRVLLTRLEMLDRVGMEDAWKAELASAKRLYSARPYARLLLAEGLRDQGHSVEAIRIGRDLREEREGWDERLLRVVFPFPFRELIEGEARAAKLDPYLFAALIRQESTFRPAVRSWVGATGLSQIMPATGRWLARGLDIESYEERLLTVPEVNLHMGARYLSDLLRRYDGARDLALAGYNAGPGRADRWRRTLGHGRDVDAFREQIPFDETRHYVKVVLRNAAVYRRLYGAAHSPGLVGGH